MNAAQFVTALVESLRDVAPTRASLRFRATCEPTVDEELSRHWQADNLRRLARVPQQYSRLILSYLEGRALSFERKYSDAMKSFEMSLSEALALALDGEDSWFIPVLNSTATNLRQCAMAADNTAAMLGEEEVAQPKAAKQLLSAFEEVQRGKKEATLCIANQLMRVYFHMKQTNLCKNIIVALSKPSFNKLSFPLPDAVTFSYFCGRYHVANSNLPEAVENFEFAFRMCHRDYTKNRRQILMYLVCAKLLRSKYPTAELLDKHNLHELVNVVMAIRQGNLRAFEEELDRNADFFMERGVYLLLERAKIIAYRNLLHRVWKIQEGARLHLSLVQVAFSVAGLEADLDEVECIVANLIFGNFVRGYISHQHQTLVLSKLDPFPRTS